VDAFYELVVPPKQEAEHSEKFSGLAERPTKRPENSLGHCTLQNPFFPSSLLSLVSHHPLY
jgi:hypothetical protein